MYLRARTKEQFDERKKEILNAMDTLYLNKELNSIYLKDISEMTRITRTAIYFYYNSKEEILLDSLYNHFIELDDGLELLVDKALTKDEIINSIAKLLEQNIIILKIMSCNLEDIERSTTLENLIVLKTELKRFELKIHIGIENVILTSTVVFIISIIISFILKKYSTKNTKQYFKIMPKYGDENFIDLQFNGIFEIKMIHIINTICIEKKKRRVEENERTSNRRSYDYSYE